MTPSESLYLLPCASKSLTLDICSARHFPSAFKGTAHMVPYGKVFPHHYNYIGLRVEGSVSLSLFQTVLITTVLSHIFVYVFIHYAPTAIF